MFLAGLTCLAVLGYLPVLRVALSFRIHFDDARKASALTRVHDIRENNLACHILSSKCFFKAKRGLNYYNCIIQCVGSIPRAIFYINVKLKYILAMRFDC